MPNNRSDAALRERLELAEKAVPKGEKTIWTADFASPHETCVRDAFTERILTMEDYTDQATAAHIAASSPDVVQADIEEILRLRQENKRLCGELERVHEEADWLAESLEIESPYCYECEFKDERYCEYEENITWCAHAPDGTNDTCDQSWREAARNAVEEKNG